MRDMTQKKFDEECAKRGYVRQHFMGYYALPSGIHVSIFNAGSKRRARLAYLMEQEERDKKRTLK